jgi:uncharacterized protein (DUF433 family)
MFPGGRPLCNFDIGLTSKTEAFALRSLAGIMGGQPCVRGMRVTVGMIVGQLSSGSSIEEILASYPYLEREDIVQALRYKSDPPPQP